MKTIDNKRVVIIFVLTFLATVIVSAVQAYKGNSLDAFWRNPYPHLYYINGCSVPNDILAVNDAARDWSSINSPHRLYLHQYWPPPNQIYVRNVFIVTYWDGWCTIYDYNHDHNLDYADISINNYWTQSYSRNKVRSVAGHEFGHSIGLGDESGAQCLEYPITETRYDQWAFTYQPKMKSMG